VRQREELLRHAVFALCCEKGFVVTTIGKVVNKFISTLYVTVMAGNCAEGEVQGCKE